MKNVLVKQKGPDSAIDSALLAGLRDPRERLGLLKLEQALIEFMKQTQDTCVDVGGHFNSVVAYPSSTKNGDSPLSSGTITPASANMQNQTTFQRCILHRLADRFEIIRESNLDGSIRLHKQPSSKIPTRLLLDVPPSEYALTSNTPENSTALSVATGLPSAASGSNNDTANTKAKKNRKMKIMKRSNSSPASSFAGSSEGQQNKNSNKNKLKNASLTDKEKAYAEARARIMGVSEEEEQSQHQQQEKAEGESSYVNSHANVSLHNSASDPSIYQHAAPSLSTTSTESAEIENRKATFRDRRQEEADPDFRRGAHMAYTNQDYSYGYYQQTPTATGGYAGYGYGQAVPSTHAPQQQQQQQYHPYGYGQGLYGYAPSTTRNPAAVIAGATAAAVSTAANTRQPPPANLNSLEDFPSLSLR